MLFSEKKKSKKLPIRKGYVKKSCCCESTNLNKTIEIDGKDYKIGDMITINGKTVMITEIDLDPTEYNDYSITVQDKDGYYKTFDDCDLAMLFARESV